MLAGCLSVIPGGCAPKTDPAQSTAFAASSGYENKTTAENTTEEATVSVPVTEPVTAPTEETKSYKDKLVINEPGIEAFPFSATYKSGSISVLAYDTGFLVIESEILAENIWEADPFQNGHSMIRMIDIASGEVIRQKEIPNVAVDVERTCLYDDGSIGLSRKAIGSYIFLDREFNECGSFDLSSWNQSTREPLDLQTFLVELRTDRKGGYFDNNGVIYYLDMDRQTVTDLGITVEGAEELHVSEILSDNNILIVNSYAKSHESFHAYDITSPDRPVHISSSGIRKNLKSAGDLYIGFYNQYEYREYRAFSINRSTSEITWFNSTEGVGWSTSTPVRNGYIYRTYDPSDLVTYVDLKNERSFDLPLEPYLTDGRYTANTGDMHCGDWEFYMFTMKAENQSPLIFMIDMDRCAQPVDLELNHAALSEYTDEEFVRVLGIRDPNEYATDHLMAKYGTLEQYANAVSEKYNVSLIYDQRGEAYSYMVPEYDLIWLIPDETTWNQIAVIDRTLGNYPEGFFKQFINNTYPEPIVICLVANMQIREGFENVKLSAGLTNMYGSPHLVVLDAYSPNLSQNIYHEFGHVIEAQIENTRTDTGSDDFFYTDEQWETLNPPDFRYMGSYAGFEEMDESVNQEYTIYGYNYAGTALEDVYFIDLYATLKSEEDRARLMEYACCFYDLPAMRSPHIQAKLKYMSEFIRHYFDDSTWPEVLPWEVALIAP